MVTFEISELEDNRCLAIGIHYLVFASWFYKLTDEFVKNVELPPVVRLMLVVQIFVSAEQKTERCDNGTELTAVKPHKFEHRFHSTSPHL